MRLLLERDGVLADLRRLSADSIAGRRGTMVLLAGEAGVGKSSVVRAFTDDIKVPVHWGACDALSTPRPLGPLIDMSATLTGVADAMSDRSARHRVFEAMLEALARPAVVVIEDAHWADAATLDLLRYLGRRVQRTAATIIVTYRDDEVEQQLRLVLGDVASAGGCHRFALDRLSAPAVATLAAGHALDPARIHAITGGNPFFVTEVLATDAWSVPPTVSDAVLARAARMSPSGRKALEIAAIETAGMERWLAFGLGADVRDLDEATDRGMLVISGDLIRFRHELARLAIVAETGLEVTRDLHARALALLVDRNGEAARLAHHAEQCGDDDATRQWAEAAADDAVRAGATKQAVEQYERALRHKGGISSVAEVALLERLAEQMIQLDRPAETLAIRRRVLALCQAIGEPADAAAARAMMGRALLSVDAPEQAYDAVVAATEALEGLPVSRQHGVACGERAMQLMLMRRREAIVWADRAIAAATQFNDDRTLAVAHNARGATRICVADDVGGVDDLEVSRRLGERHGWESIVGIALGNLGSGLGEVRRYELAAQYLEAGIAHDGARDFDRSRRYDQAWLARVRFEQGRWAEADALVTDEFDRVDISSIAVIAAITVRGRLRVRRGDHDPLTPLARAWGMAREAGLQRSWPVMAGRVEHAWLTASVTVTMRHELLELLEAAEGVGVRYAIGELGFWAWKLGDRDDIHPDAAAPYAAHVTGDLSQAVTLWDELGAPYEAAWALADIGDEPSLRAALDRFLALGAAPMAHRVRRELRRLGAIDVPRGPRASTRRPGGLTERERDVLALVVAGLSDRAIGERLFVSTKTAGHHVSAILRKLGVRTRAEAAALARPGSELSTVLQDRESSR